MARSRALVWGRRLLFGAGVVGAGSYGAVTMWIRQYDNGKTGKIRKHRVLVDEDGALIDQTLAVPKHMVILRFVQLFLHFFPLLLSYPMVLMLPGALQDWWYNHFIRTVQRAGPAFIKLAQWLATRRDIVNPEFRVVLQRLFDHVDPHSMDHTRTLIKEDLGVEPEEIFEWIDPNSVGSGSIAQVHKAKLKEEHGGHVVAVKVCHPNVRENIALDFHVLNALAKFVDRFCPSTRWLLLPNQALAWTTHLAQQIDLRIEAENLEIFLENFEDQDTDRFATFPKPIYPFVSNRVLVEEFVQNAHTADEDYLVTLPDDFRTHLAEVGMDTYMKFLMRDNWLHGDLHPGNIMIEKEAPPGKKWPRVFLVDCGLCQNLEPEEKDVAIMVLEGFAKWKGDVLTTSFWRMGHGWTQREEVKFDDMLETVNEVFAYYQPSKGSDAAIVGRLLESMFDVVRHHKVQIEPQFTSLLFGALVQENFIMTLDDNFNIIHRVIPWLASHGIQSKSMLKQYFNLTDYAILKPFFESKDVKEELGPELSAKGLLTSEGGQHMSIEKERELGGKKEWKQGLLGADGGNGTAAASA